MSGRLYHLEGHWYEWRQKPALDGEVRVKIEPDDDGRLEIGELRIVGQPTSELLRSIPVGRIEATANAQLTVVDDVVTAAPVRRRPRPVSEAARQALLDDAGWDELGPATAGGANPEETDGRGRPDTFYADIAADYLDLARTSRRPAAELAERHRVPVTTAHRWIKEARRRGHLAPGRPGKAG